MAIEHVDEKSFDKEVRNSKVPVIVDFYAEWCGPCKVMTPIFEEVGSKYQGKVKFVKVDVDANQALAQEFGIMSIPTLVVFEDGKAIDTLNGLQDEESLTEKAEKLAK
jgi:thioredoxin 1